MTGYLTTAAGETWRLPEILEWEILRTDGDGCDSAQVVFLYEPVRLNVLKQAVRLRLEEDGRTAFFGVVDEFSAQVGPGGRRVEMSCRGLMALLLDSQLRAAKYSCFQMKEAVRRLVEPFGVTAPDTDLLPPVRNFSWDTGATPWSVLCGFCRHSAGVKPRFTADGRLVLYPGAGEIWELDESAGYLEVTFRQKRYGVIARQITVHSGGAAEHAKNPPFIAMGGTTEKVSLKTGTFLNAAWRTGKQRVEDSMDGAVTVEVVLPGLCGAQPGDRVRLNLEKPGITGEFILKSSRMSCGRAGRKTVLEMEGSLG